MGNRWRHFADRTTRPRKPWRTRLLNIFWPQMGWRRYGRFLHHKLGRLPGSAYSVAAGFAWGASISVTPLFGVHVVLAVIFAWIFRANIIAALVGTLVANPWTYFLFLYWDYEIGRRLLNVTSAPSFLSILNIEGLRTQPLETIGPIFWPLLVGSIPVAIVVWSLSCCLLYSAIKRYKSQRLERQCRLKSNDGC